MTRAVEQPVTDYYIYPHIGGGDWRYTFQTARVRVYETQLLTRPTLLDMANAQAFPQAADLLNGTEYALQAPSGFADVQRMLLDRRTAYRPSRSAQALP